MWEESKAGPEMASSNSFNTTVLFKQEKGFGYRIPALLHIPNTDTLLAFAEKRLGSRDEDADVFMLRRGTYKKDLRNFEWEGVTSIQSARLNNHRSMNPCPVYDKDTGTVFLFFIVVFGNTPELHQIRTGKNVTRLCFVTSKDKGQNWSNPTDLTDCTIGQCINKWATFAVGPGHGIQLRSGSLIIPAHAYEKQSDGRVISRVFTFFSDDHGESWNFGDFVSSEECGECQMVSLDQADGSCVLYCNARSIKHGEKQYRVQAFSTDGGHTFTEGHLVKKLVEPPNGCHGSITHFPASKISHVSIYPVIEEYHCQQEKDASKSAEDFEIILFSHTTNFKSRRDLGIYLSTCPGNPHTWTKPWIIYSGPSAYSELAFVEFPGKEIPIVTCLFECGSKYECEQISFSVFQVDEVIKNILKKTTD
uniref:sialidase-2-like isoform X1 n=2 Tax=Pristiophorus japonicus TaxID=55135 RepID=UPI00398EA342